MVFNQIQIFKRVKKEYEVVKIISKQNTKYYILSAKIWVRRELTKQKKKNEDRSSLLHFIVAVARAGLEPATSEDIIRQFPAKSSFLLTCLKEICEKANLMVLV